MAHTYIYIEMCQKVFCCMSLSIARGHYAIIFAIYAMSPPNTFKFHSSWTQWGCVL